MKISSRPLEALLAKLRDPSKGFNFQIAAKSGAYRLKPYTLDFPPDIYSKNTVNFFMGQVNPEQISDQGPVGHTRAWLYTFSSDNQNYEKPSNFSGTIRVGLDFNLEWTCSASDQNFETPSLLLEDAVSEIIQPYQAQNWGTDVVYNGAFSCQRTMVDQSSSGSTKELRQLVLFRMLFQLTD
jgi:hypothetical protein